MVAIKDMEMPKSCGECDFKEDYCFYCNKLQKRIPQSNFFDSRLPDCPLVEIEPLTDSEQRIFLSAMSREMHICKQLDNDKVDDGTVKKLEPIVSSIKRKVKKALWGAENG